MNSVVWEGRWTLITGASSGLGESFARQLAAKRAQLILTARSEDKLRALAAELSAQHGVSVEVVVCDLGAPGGAVQLCQKVDQLGHDVEHLVSNAGFGLGGGMVELDAARQGDMVRLNCEALTVLDAHFGRGMVARRSGGILHVASIAGYQPVPFMATYGATKAYVVSLSLALGEELRPAGVRVSALCPGPVATGFQAVAGRGIVPSQRRAVLSAEETVARGIGAYEAGRDLCVPGGYNKLGAFAVRLVPRRMLLRTVGKMMRDKPVLTT